MTIESFGGNVWCVNIDVKLNKSEVLKTEEGSFPF